jgi:ribonuclease R
VEPTREDIVSVLSDASSQGLKAREIARRLHVRAKDLKSFRRLLDELETEGSIVLGRRRRYYLPSQAGHVTGRFSGYGLEVATLIPSDGSSPLTIGAENFSGARHGDMVVARIVKGPEGEKRAQVVKVIERAPAETIGEVYGSGEEKLIGVDPGKQYRRVMFDKKSKARPGDYVVVRIDTWGEPYEKARGRVSEVLGGKLSPGEDFARIAREHNLPLDFPRDVKREVTKIPAGIPESEVARREDLTDLLTFTIDPEDAKDFDDAISVEKLDSDRFRVGVHIADVSHFVREGSRLDHEALARGRSVYLVDRVIPMLPEKLSGNLASLRPEELRLTVSVFMELDREGQLLSYDIKETVIRSDKRLTYDEAQKLIEKRWNWRASKTVKRVSEALKYANFIAQTLKEKRKARGAIELETSEVDIKVDASGRAVEIKPEKRLASHNLIEELMILANETIADHMSYLGRMFIYRVHEVPDEDDMRELSTFAEGFGHRFRWTRGVSPHALQALLARAKGRPEELIISMFLLRSLKKAIYSERNVGHFGLASKCYAHFTSPIRRYPDLVVHRLLKRYGIRRSSPRDSDGLLRFVKRASSVATAREIESDEAERAAIKARLCEFMEQRIGEEYWGTVSGIMDFGFFVILDENLAEGLVHVSTLGKDYYTLDRTGTSLVGSRTKTHFSVGDRLKVKVVRVDRTRREIDFMLLAREGREGEMPVYAEPERKVKRRKIFQKTEEGMKQARKTRKRREAREQREEKSAAKTRGKVDRKRGRRPRQAEKPKAEGEAKAAGRARRKAEPRAKEEPKPRAKSRTRRGGRGRRPRGAKPAASKAAAEKREPTKSAGPKRRRPRRSPAKDSPPSGGDRPKQERRSGRPRRRRPSKPRADKVTKS